MNNENGPINTTESVLERRKEEGCEVFTENVIKLVCGCIIDLIISIFYYLFFNKITISETIKNNIDISFPFIDLIIVVPKQNKVTVDIIYKFEGKIISKPKINLTIIDVKSVLGVKKLELESENDVLFFEFRNVSKISKDDYIIIANKIYSLNSSNNERKINPVYKFKTFNLEDEFFSSLDKYVKKMYQYSIQSYSIKWLYQMYNFPVINYTFKQSYHTKKLRDDGINNLLLVTSFVKSKYLNVIEIKKLPFLEILTISFVGNVVNIFVFFHPFLQFLKNKIKIRFKEKVPGNQNLVQNEVNHQDQNNDINVTNVEENN